MTELATPVPAGAAGLLELSGGEALARMLQAHEAGPIFGMGGFQLLPFYAAIHDAGLEHHLVNDERCGAFMADGVCARDRPGRESATERWGPGRPTW